MHDAYLDSQFVETLDQQGNLVTLTLRQALARKRQEATEQDKALGIQRQQIPVFFINLPDVPERVDFQNLAKEIRRIAACDYIVPETPEQGAWLRCNQLYWEAKAIVLANKIYKLIPDPTQPGQHVSEMLPARGLENLKLEVEADLALFDLLKAGEAEVKAWAEAQKIPYSFTSSEELFVSTLKSDFESNVTDEAFAPPLEGWSRKQARDHHRGWLKFLGDHFDGEPKEKEYEARLLSMGWKGYVLLALRSKKREKPFDKLWKSYLNRQRFLCKFLDSRLEWKNDLPYQSVTVKGRRTRTQNPIQGITTDEGYFDWQWR